MRGVRRPPRKSRKTVRVLSAGGVVFDRRGRVLLLRRVGEGTWCFPKGHVERGESLQATARREIKEECGLDVVLGRRIGEVRYAFYSRADEVNHDKRVVYFLAESLDSMVTLESRFDAWRWVSPTRALRMLPYRNDKAIFRAAMKARSATGKS